MTVRVDMGVPHRGCASSRTDHRPRRLHRSRDLERHQQVTCRRQPDREQFSFQPGGCDTRALWDRMKDDLAADDLFWRVSCFFFALFGVGFAVLIAWVMLSSARESWWLWQALLWLVAAGLFAWAAVLLLGCLSPPDSRSSRWADGVLPAIVDFEGKTSAFGVVAFFPAAALTLLLHGIGVRGCRSPQSAELIEEAEQNTRSPWPDLTP
jgi:hypothetical protein